MTSLLRLLHPDNWWTQGRLRGSVCGAGSSMGDRCRYSTKGYGFGNARRRPGKQENSNLSLSLSRSVHTAPRLAVLTAICIYRMAVTTQAVDRSKV